MRTVIPPQFTGEDLQRLLALELASPGDGAPPPLAGTAPTDRLPTDRPPTAPGPAAPLPATPGTATGEPSGQGGPTSIDAWDEPW